MVDTVSISLIVSTYNQPDFLALALHGVAAQEDRDFELVIADDGSDKTTKGVIDHFISEHNIKTTHIWHEDTGYNKADILNKAITATKGEYIIFLDGDCIPRKSYISDHRKLSQHNRIVGCSRVLLDQTITQHIVDNELHPEEWSFFAFLKLRLSGHINRIFALIPLPMGFLRNITPRRWQKIRGCNFAIPRDVLLKTGGFDESFTGWGFEDSDLTSRAIENGCFVKRGEYLATVVHLWHQDAARDLTSSNLKHLQETLSTRRKTAVLSQLLNNDD